MRHFLLALLPLAAVIAAPALAQDVPGSTRSVDELASCRAVTPGADRLACFDRATDRILAARRSGELLVLDRKQVTERKRRAFGLANPRAEVFGGGREDELTEVKEVETTIAIAAPAAAYGRWNLQLANGMVWQSIDTLSFPPKVGAPIKLKNASLGGFRASINGGRSFLVKRMR